MSEPKKYYKGLDKDFKCRGHAFEIGQSYHYDGTVSPCNSGFHACENPVDVWTYYGPAESRYAEVELFGTVLPHSEDSKSAASDIKIVREIDGKEFLALVIARIFGDAKPDADPSGDYAKIGSSGYSAKIGSSGDYAKIGSSGDYAKINATGQNAVIASAGIKTIASGAIGTWISLAEFDDNYRCIGFATGCIGQDGLLPGVAYKAKGGKLVDSATGEGS